MVGNTPLLTTPRKNVSGSAITVAGQILYVPLEFWFARNPGLASENIGQKSIQTITYGHCYSENLFESHDFFKNQTQMLVGCC